MWPRTKIATLAPSLAAEMAAEIPPIPPPKMITSCLSDEVFKLNYKDFKNFYLSKLSL
jgi:hypothetical protein